MVLEGGQPTFGTCPFLCALNLSRAAIAIAITMYVSCQQSPQKEVLREEP